MIPQPDDRSPEPPGPAAADALEAEGGITPVGEPPTGPVSGDLSRASPGEGVPDEGEDDVSPAGPPRTGDAPPAR